MTVSKTKQFLKFPCFFKFLFFKLDSKFVEVGENSLTLEIAVGRATHEESTHGNLKTICLGLHGGQVRFRNEKVQVGLKSDVRNETNQIIFFKNRSHSLFES